MPSYLKRRTIEFGPHKYSWPGSIVDDPLVLRPLEKADAAAFQEQRRANADWLAPWDPTSPTGEKFSPPPFETTLQRNREGVRQGTILPYGIFYQGRFVGQVNASCFMWGALSSCSIGYWVDQRVAGRGIMTYAVAMLIDELLTKVGVHRVEINIRPENQSSLRVVQKLGLRFEGIRERYLHIDGAWRDHKSFAITQEEHDTPLTRRVTAVL